MYRKANYRTHPSTFGNKINGIKVIIELTLIKAANIAAFLLLKPSAQFLLTLANQVNPIYGTNRDL
jgi:hypothetical protein